MVGADGATEDFVSLNRWPDTARPLLVLVLFYVAHKQIHGLVYQVNSLTASASEIFAAALSDNNRGTLLGDATFGKVVLACSFWNVSCSVYV
jgi:hypothetical protein